MQEALTGVSERIRLLRARKIPQSKNSKVTNYLLEFLEIWPKTAVKKKSRWMVSAPSGEEDRK